MRDLEIVLENRPGELARLAEVLGRADVNIEGGGKWVVNGEAVAHFLFDDGMQARRIIQAAGFQVRQEREVLIQRLKQAEPGQLGLITRSMAEAGVNIEVLYSDHDHRLVLGVDNLAIGRAVSEAWEREHGSSSLAPRVVARKEKHR